MGAENVNIAASGDSAGWWSGGRQFRLCKRLLFQRQRDWQDVLAAWWELGAP